jgi:hypothetical protein
VGFNPFREHETSALDIVIVVFAALATLGAIAWAIFSG